MNRYRHDASFKVGARVEMHPATEEWMRGDRYGVVILPAFIHPHYTVRLDSGKLVRVLPQDIRHV